MTSAAFRLTPLAVTALALLEEGPMHPYEMLQLLNLRGKAALLQIKPPSLYHSMNRLVEVGFVTVHGTEREGNRPERTVYALTAAGRAAYIAWVRVRLDDPASPQEFAVALAECHNLGPDEVAAVLGRRCDRIVADLAELDDQLAAARARALPEAFLLESDRRRAMLAADLAWTSDLLRRLDADEVVWSLDDPRAGAPLHARKEHS
ncbi:PadR family transcriptional regulator [Agromyces intestinalis]|uniref:PadR family transcriptional regulator n=1 Tax=Agromyces intestinalis TaxID=2592652 RepID=A0A5C1YKF7_9MICO|nr:PadR family transcriptional regulator [Agromyces intestinalis]QEO15282.1 PadR family transcriptional regulator [Agromyces intestinalis]